MTEEKVEEIKNKKCNCDESCDCGCQEGKECTCENEECQCGCHGDNKAIVKMKNASVKKVVNVLVMVRKKKRRKRDSLIRINMKIS